MDSKENYSGLGWGFFIFLAVRNICITVVFVVSFFLFWEIENGPWWYWLVFIGINITFTTMIQMTR